MRTTASAIDVQGASTSGRPPRLGWARLSLFIGVAAFSQAFQCASSAPFSSIPIGTPCPHGGTAKDPVSYGSCAVAQAELDAKISSRVVVAVITEPGAEQTLAEAQVTLDPRAESYAVVPTPNATVVVGRDAVGAMYGALEVAEKLTNSGASALPLSAPLTGAPSVPLRAANPFIVLPLSNEPSWWFLDPSFWQTYLDMMAHARLDYLDMHGAFNLDNSHFPNLLLWFATSASFPSIGVAPSEREQNLAMLKSIVSAAAIRGIRVGLTNYDTNTSPWNDGQGPTLSASDLATYTTEATEYLVTQVPALAYMGFRIGESREPTSFYEDTVLAALKDADSGANVTTRTWLTQKSDILDIVQSTGPETLVEAKYNGEQLGAPYVISGGRASQSDWVDYFYQNYLTSPTPYRFVFQVRAGGTHRIFRFASYARAQRTVVASALSPRVGGLSFEAAHAYSSQRDFYHANPEDSFSPWTFRRDELYYLLMGRLAYDPTTPEEVFRGALAARVGTDGLWDAVQSASDIVPWIVSAFTCGPDQNQDAPELELGGPVAYWATGPSSPPPEWACIADEAHEFGHGPFDTFSIAAPLDAATNLVAGQGTSRLSPVDIALTLLSDAEKARAASQVTIDESNAEARDYVRECIALADLGEWFAHKLRAATALAVYTQVGDKAWLDTVNDEITAANTAYTTLASDTAYIEPWVEHERMIALGLSPFHWKAQLPRLPLEMESIATVAAQVAASPPHFSGTLPDPKTWLNTPRPSGPGLESLTLSPEDPNASGWTVRATFQKPVAAGSHVDVLYRHFDADAMDWAYAPAHGAGATWEARVPATNDGLMYAVEISGPPGGAYRYPDVRQETPYRVLAP